MMFRLKLATVRFLSLFVLHMLAAQTHSRREPVPKSATVESLRRSYIGKAIVIQQADTDWKGEHVMWMPAEIIAIDPVHLNGTTTKLFKPNAFGETTVPKEGDVNPYVVITARLLDGTTATTEVFEHNFCCERDRFQLKYVPLRITDSRAEHAPLIKAKLTEIVGAKLYASRHSQLFAASATREEPAARSGTLWEGSQGTYFHPDWLFHPLTIMRADYDEASDSLFFELKMPNGTVALAATSYVDEGPRSSFLESVEGSLFA